MTNIRGIIKCVLFAASMSLILASLALGNALEDGLNVANSKINYTEIINAEKLIPAPQELEKHFIHPSSTPRWYQLPSGERVACISSQTAISIANANVKGVYKLRDEFFYYGILLFFAGVIMMWCDKTHKRRSTP